MKDLDLTKIFSSMKDNGISELVIKEGSKLYEVRRGGFKQRVVASGAQPIVQHMPQGVQHHSPSPAASVEAEPTKEKKAEKSDAKGSDLYELKSPLVGTFYASPKPDSPSFVEVGDKIKKGQTLCVVEAMKNFNEIESDVNGVIREICVNNQELVEFGKVLFRIELR